jgi:hypothetical protein
MFMIKKEVILYLVLFLVFLVGLNWIDNGGFLNNEEVRFQSAGTFAPINFPNNDVYDRDQIVQFKFPLPKGSITSLNNNFKVLNSQGVSVPADLKVWSRWDSLVSDTSASIKFVQVTMPVSVSAQSVENYNVEYGLGVGSPPSPTQQVTHTQSGTQGAIHTIDTGAAVYTLREDTFDIIESINIGGQNFIMQTQESGVNITEPSISNLNLNAAQGTNQLVVTETGAYSPGDVLEITPRYMVNLDGLQSWPSGSSAIGIQSGALDILSGDFVTIAKGSSREETRQIQSITVDPSVSSFGAFVRNINFGAGNGLTFNHYAMDTVELANPISVTVASIQDNHRLTLTQPLTRNLFSRTDAPFSGTEVIKPNSIRQFSPKNRPTTNFVIEESGPLRFVVRVEGGYGDNSGNPLKVDYITRLIFYAGKPYVHVTNVLWNKNPMGISYAGNINNKNIYLQEYGYTLNLPWQANSVSFDVSDNFESPQSHTIPLSSGDVARQIVTSSAPPRLDRSKTNVVPDTTVRNIVDNIDGNIKVNGQISYQAGGNGAQTLYLPDGIVSLTDGQKTLAVGVLDFWERYDNAITVTPTSIKTEFKPADMGYGPTSDGPSRRFPRVFNLEGGSQIQEQFLIYPTTSQITPDDIKNKIYSELHRPLYPDLHQQYYDTQANFAIPYTLETDWTNPQLGLSPEDIEIYERYELWQKTILEENPNPPSVGSLTFPSSLKNYERFGGGLYGDESWYGKTTFGTMQWADGRTLHTDRLELIIDYLRSGDVEHLYFNRPVADMRSLYRTFTANPQTGFTSGVGAEVYEKNSQGSQRNFDEPRFTHSWFNGLHTSCLVLNHYWACENLKNVAEGQILGGYYGGNPFHVWGCNTGGGSTRKEYGLNTLANLAYEMFGNVAYLDYVEQEALECANEDMNQPNGPLGIIPDPANSIVHDPPNGQHSVPFGDPWKSSRQASTFAEYVRHKTDRGEQPPQIVLDYLHNYVDWLLDVNQNPISNPHGPLFVGCSGPNNNWGICANWVIYYMDPNFAPYDTSKSNIGSMIVAMTQIYRALQPYSMEDETWGDVVKLFTESTIKFVHVGGSTANRYDPSNYGKLSYRITHYQGTQYKAAIPMLTWQVATGVALENLYRSTCAELGGNICDITTQGQAQACLGNTVPSSSGACCVPSSGSQTCVYDSFSPIVQVNEPPYPMQNGITSLTITVDTDENAECYITSNLNHIFNPTNPEIPQFGITGTKSHQTLISGLNQGTNNKKVFCKDLNNNVGTDTFVITVSSSGAPNPYSVSGVQISSTDISASVMFSTSPAFTTVNFEYGTTPGYGNLVTSTGGLLENHDIQLTGLLASTTYYYRISSADEWGNVVQNTGTFTTQNQAVNIVIENENWHSTTNPNPTNIADETSIQSAFVNRNTQQTGIQTGKRINPTPNQDINRALVRFDLSSIPTALDLNSMNAKLRMQLKSIEGTSSVNVNVHKIISSTEPGFGDWNSLAAAIGESSWIHINNPTVWSNCDTSQVNSGAQNYLNTNCGGTGDFDLNGVTKLVTTNTGTWFEWDVTNIVKDWLQGTNPNYGFMIKAQDESVTGTYMSFKSANDDYNTQADVPELVITGQTTGPGGSAPAAPTGLNAGFS